MNFVEQSYKKKTTRCTKAPAYAESGKESHHLVYCTQSYLVFYTRSCFQDLNPWSFNHMTTTLPVAYPWPFGVLLNKAIIVKKNWFNYSI